MSRYIDADAFNEKYGDYYAEEVGIEGGFIGTVGQLIDNSPTVEERPKGKWIGDTDYESCQGNYERYKCSECGYGIDWREHIFLMRQDEILEENREYYCEHCGADMRGDV